MEILESIVSTIAYGLILLGLLIAVVQEFKVRNSKKGGSKTGLIENVKREIRYPFYIAGFILLIIMVWIK